MAHCTLDLARDYGPWKMSIIINIIITLQFTLNWTMFFKSVWWIQDYSCNNRCWVGGWGGGGIGHGHTACRVPVALFVHTKAQPGAEGPNPGQLHAVSVSASATDCLPFR